MNRTLGYSLRHVSQMAMIILHERIRQYGVAVGQFPVLVHLWEEQGLTQRALCDRINVEQPTLANTLKRMERDGLLERIPDEDDKRQRRIYLTEKATRLQGVLQEESRRVNALIVDRMTEAEQQEFVRLLETVASTLEDELSAMRRD